MNYNDLERLYDEMKKEFGVEAYKHISELLIRAKEIHKSDWEKHPTPKNDHEQSWKPFKGNALERLILYIIEDAVESLGLKVVRGIKFVKTKPENLSLELKRVKKNISIDYGEFGFHHPDVDLVIYNPNNYEVLAVLSSKSSLRERIAQTGYWKIKIKNDELTKHIKVFFFTLDEDGEFIRQFPISKPRVIAEVDTDGSYVMTEGRVEESSKVKLFEYFIDDLRKLLENGR